MRRLLTPLLTIALCSPSLGLAETHPFSVQDLVTFERLSDLRLSPDGKALVFALRSTDLEGNRGTYDLWRVGVDGNDLRRLTSHPAADQSPRFAPDGKSILFLSSRGGATQVWRLPVDGGEAAQVTSLPLEVEDFLVVPDGRLLVALSVFPDCKDIDCTLRRDEDLKKRKATGRVYDRLFVRHWDTWNDGKRRHIFLWSPAAPARDLMPGVDGDCPSKPWGGMEEVALSPDGKELTYTARVVGREEAWSVDFNLWRIPLDGDARTPACLTCDNRAWDTQPSYSPDGKTLAYLAMTRPGYEADRFHIRLVDRASGKTRPLAEDWDRAPAAISWSPDSKRLYAVADNLGQQSLFAIDAASGKTAVVVEQGNNDLPAMTKDRLFFLRDTLTSPAEIFSVRPDGKDLRQITRVNGDRLARVRMGAAEQFSFAGARGEKVHAYLVKPVDFVPGKRYPIAVLVHGGPQGSFGNHFHYRWNPQTYAGAGIAALAIDFHGSTGYGQAFTDSIRDDWGGAPYEDIIKGLDAAVARFPFIDGSRACALGASFGGYMIYWIAGQTDRFRCLVSHDGNIDEKAAYFNTEELWFPEWEHRGTPWDNPVGYNRHNPIDHVGKWKTPMLVVHGGMDFRVVETEGLSAFNALQRRGIPSKLLHFPDENHWVLKPHNSILWHDTVLAWLKQWL